LSRFARTIGLLLGLVTLAALPAVGLGAFAAADSGPASTDAAGSDPAPHRRPPLTDEQRQCLADHGVTPRSRPADGAPRPVPGQADRDALRAAAEACGLPRPEHRGGPGAGPRLTDEQRQCLADHGVTPRSRPADGAPRPVPSQADRDALRAAAEACGLPLRTPHGAPRTA
jgi:hypothetical protein